MGNPRRRKPCDMCGKTMVTELDSPRCHACRQVHSRDARRNGHRAKCNECEWCGLPAARRFCSAECSNKWHGKARQIRHSDDRRVKRGQRQTTAPGLGYRQQRALVAKWIKQGRTCIYWPREGCTGKAAELEHVLPLVRGGTNYEGNLAPVCKHCNSSKSGLTVIEWMHNRRLPPVDTCPTMAPSITRTKRTKQFGTPVQLEMRLCVACGAMHVRDSDYCSGRCHSRSLYRLRVGKPITDPLDNRGRRAVA